MKKPTTLFVLIGLGADKKPHAARFELAEMAHAAKAAKLMGFRFGKAATPEALASASQLPKGRLFPQGKALIPLVKGSLFEKLEKLLEFPELDAVLALVDAVALPAFDAETVWNALKAGNIVLYSAKGLEDGWWEAVIDDISPDKNTLTLRWRGAMHEKPFKARRGEVALIMPFGRPAAT